MRGLRVGFGGGLYAFTSSTLLFSAHFTPLQYSLTGAMMVGGLASDAWLESPAHPRWRSQSVLDDGARQLLATGSESGRRRASQTSDLLTLGLLAYPFAIDGLLVAAGLERSYDVAWQMTMIGLQSIMLSKLLTRLTKRLVGRARPDYGRCAGGDELACSSDSESFISGHTSSAFVGAGLMCTHHQNLRLYGSGVASAVVCGAALAAATTSGALRIVADRHHLTDVLADAAIGFGAGFLLPNLTNYDDRAATGSAPRVDSVAVRIDGASCCPRLGPRARRAAAQAELDRQNAEIPRAVNAQIEIVAVGRRAHLAVVEAARAHAEAHARAELGEVEVVTGEAAAARRLGVRQGRADARAERAPVRESAAAIWAFAHEPRVFDAAERVEIDACRDAAGAETSPS